MKKGNQEGTKILRRLRRGSGHGGPLPWEIGVPLIVLTQHSAEQKEEGRRVLGDGVGEYLHTHQYLLAHPLTLYLLDRVTDWFFIPPFPQPQSHSINHLIVVKERGRLAF